MRNSGALVEFFCVFLLFFLLRIFFLPCLILFTMKLICSQSRFQYSLTPPQSSTSCLSVVRMVSFLFCVLRTLNYETTRCQVYIYVITLMLIRILRREEWRYDIIWHQAIFCLIESSINWTTGAESSWERDITDSVNDLRELTAPSAAL